MGNTSSCGFTDPFISSPVNRPSNTSADVAEENEFDVYLQEPGENLPLSMNKSIQASRAVSRKDLYFNSQNKKSFFIFPELQIKKGKRNGMHDLIHTILGFKNITKNDYRWELLLKRIKTHPDEITKYDDDCMTPLLLVCRSAITPERIIASMLNSRPSAATLPDTNGSFPLHFYVAHTGCKEYMVLRLIDCHREALVSRNRYGSTPLSLAISSAPTDDSLEEMSEASGSIGRNNKDKSERDLCINALLRANPEAARLQNRHGNYPVHFVGRCGNSISKESIASIVEAFPGALIKRNIYGASPIFQAIYWDANEVVLKTLLQSNPGTALIEDEQGLCAISLAWNLFINGTKAYNDSSESCDADDSSEVQQYRVQEKERVTRNRHMILQADLPVDLEGDAEIWWDRMQILLQAAYSSLEPTAVTIFSLSDDTSNSARELGETDSEPPTWRLLHAVAAVKCPPNLLRFALKLYRRQLFLKDDKGRIPLHLTAEYPAYVPLYFEKSSCSGEPALVTLASAHPNSVRETDNSGRLPLHTALESKKMWDDGVSYIVELYPDSVKVPHPKSDLLPFMMATIKRSRSSEYKIALDKARRSNKLKEWRKFSERKKDNLIDEIIKERELHQFNTVYHLIRTAPEIVLNDVNLLSHQHGKQYLKNSNAFLSTQINEMVADVSQLKIMLNQKKENHMKDIEDLTGELKKLKESMGLIEEDEEVRTEVEIDTISTYSKNLIQFLDDPMIVA